MNIRHTEHHNMLRIGWLRAAVLGANDGIVSTASIIVGVAAAAPGVGEGHYLIRFSTLACHRKR